MAKIGQDAKAIAFAKWSKKCQKGAKNDSTTVLEFCVQKTGQNT